jgi:thiamine-phosphate pyrophosphorylase
MMDLSREGFHPGGRLSLFPGSVYAILDDSFLEPERIPPVAGDMARAGVRIFQLRMKQSSPRQVLETARELAPVLRKEDALFLINDYPDIASLSGADGVHLGQDDIPAREARKLLGEDALIGVSTHNRMEIEKALEEGPDYIAIGPFFDTTTKAGREMMGLGQKKFRELAGMVSLPVVAIGGISEENIHLVPGDVSTAVISFLYRGDPAENARKLVEKRDDLFPG